MEPMISHITRFSAVVGAVALAGLSSPALAQSCAGHEAPGMAKLVVEATGLRNANGQVAFTVYADDQRKFLAKGGKLLRIRVPAAAPVTRACFWLPPGKYEVAQYHDENGDQDFNRTLLIPKEGFGFSNDVSTTFGRPSMEDARFTVPVGRSTMRMRMRYRR